MPLLGRKRKTSSNPNNLTGAGQLITREDVDSVRRVYQPWQDRAFEYYNGGGPAWYASQFYARMLAPLRLVAMEKNEDGDLVETENEVAIQQLERIQDPGGGRANLLSTYGRLMFLAGESILFVSLDSDSNEQWEMLSHKELTVEDRSYRRSAGPGLPSVEYTRPTGSSTSLRKGEGIAYRLWRRHPQWSALADSPMRSALDDLEEHTMLTRAVRARSRSRTAGKGVWLLDDRVSKAPLEPAPDEDPQEDVFLANLIQALTASMANEGVASEAVPMLVRVPVPDGMKISDMSHFLSFTDPNELYQEAGLRMETIRRIAIDLDMPPEVLTGTADLNHWSAWLVDENTWKGHGEPVANQLVDDLSSSYYRPTLKKLGVENWPDHYIGYDESGVVNHPDRSKDAKDLHDRLAISDDALRDANNFTEDDAIQEEDEWNRRVGILIRDGSLAVYGIPSIKSGGIEPQSGEVEKGPSSGGTVDSGQSAAEAPKNTPTEPGTDEKQATQASANGNHNLASMLVQGAAQAALLRAREVAGNRILSLAKKAPAETQERLKGVRTPDVAVVLGRDEVRALGAPPERELVRGGHNMLVLSLHGWGIQDPDLCEQIVQAVEQYAARTLYEPRAAMLPPSLSSYLAGLVSGVIQA